MKNMLYKILLILLCFLPANADVTIAISKGSGSDSYLRYGEWIKSIAPEAKIVDLFSMPLGEALEALQNSSGLILSGGADVHPGRYGKEYDTLRCEITPERDTLEFALIALALKLEMPIFAICRGEQILNVALGGSLIVDIPEDLPSEIPHSCEDKFSNCHTVEIVSGTLLSDIAGVVIDSVTSSHHQAVDRLAEGLRANCYSPEGLIEGFEWENPESKPFMIAVQWHPERMKSESLSRNIALKFLKACYEYKHNK